MAAALCRLFEREHERKAESFEEVGEWVKVRKRDKPLDVREVLSPQEIGVLIRNYRDELRRGGSLLTG